MRLQGGAGFRGNGAGQRLQRHAEKGIGLLPLARLRRKCQHRSADILDILRTFKPGDPLPKGPLLRMVEPDAHDAEVLKLAYGLVGTSNKTLNWVYGGKNGRTLKWLNAAIDNGAAA